MSDPLLRRTLETLLSPLGKEGELTDSWRDEVNRTLRRWVGSDAAFFRISDRSPTRLDPLSQELLDARDAYRQGGYRSLDPWATQRVGPGEELVASFRRLLGDDWKRRSSYYLDYLEPRGVVNYVGAQVGSEFGEFVSLAFFDLRKPEDEAVIARRLRRVHAVLPALKAGLEVWLAMRSRGQPLRTMVDELPEALLLCDVAGRPVHANSAFSRLVGSDPETTRLRELLGEIARDFAMARVSDVQDLYPRAAARTVHTARGAYVVRPVVADGRVHGDDPEEEGGVLLMVRQKHAPHLFRSAPDPTD